MLIDLFLSMPASRKHEAEADYIGLMVMAQGWYRPEAAMEFWARVEKTGQKGPPQILLTHPSNHNREEKIREWLPGAQEKAEMSECLVTSQYVSQFSSAFDSLGCWWAAFSKQSMYYHTYNTRRYSITNDDDSFDNG
jgi:hypothetical protein